MDPQPTSRWVAFGGRKLVACGPPRQVIEQLLDFAARRPEVSPQVFDAVTSEPVELDLRGSRRAVLGRLPRAQAPAIDAEPAGEPADAARGPGRPRLGVVAREVTLLPRHWDWLTAQPGGASVALRKLVEQALRSTRDCERARLATESAYRFMHAMAGNEPGFEEAARALFGRDLARCRQHMQAWPRDVRTHAASLLERIAGDAAQPGAGAGQEPLAAGAT